ncbi:MAG: hypothetical protein ACXVJ7_19055 [Acidimicrobiia bacterium]
MTEAQPRKPLRFKALTTLILVGATATAVAACGGSSGSASATHTTSTQKGQPTAMQSNADIGGAVPQSKTHGVGGAAHGSQPARVPTSVRPAGQVQTARQTPSATRDDDAATGGTALNPCTLVSLSEARSITRGKVSSTVEAPLGPTCVYKLAKSYITMTVETVSFSQLKHQLKKRQAITIQGHRGYCGRLGAEMLFVPLSRTQLLNVTAPCEVATRFAVKALNRRPA